MGVLDQVRTRARRTGAGAAKAGQDIVKAPSRLIQSARSGRDSGDGTATKPEPASGPAEPLLGDGVLGRVRSNALRVVAVAAGGLLVIGWIAWAVYVTSENGAAAGLGVVIAWPALLSGLVLVALPFVGIALLIRRSRDADGDATAGVEVEEPSDEDDEGEEGEDDEPEAEPGEDESADESAEEADSSDVPSSAR